MTCLFFLRQEAKIGQHIISLCCKYTSSYAKPEKLLTSADHFMDGIIPAVLVFLVYSREVIAG
jgi:hypothetical protein